MSIFVIAKEKEPLWKATLIQFYYFFIRPIYKGIVRFLTGKCELVRIIEGRKEPDRTHQIEICLLHSRTLFLQSLFSAKSFSEFAVNEVIRLKSIAAQMSIERFKDKFGEALKQIVSANKLKFDAEEWRKTKFDESSESHNQLLTTLTDNLLPGRGPLPRLGSHWTELGFQGSDPITDLRGMGLLGLQQLAYFSEKNTDDARSLLVSAQHPKIGYSFAITGINITAAACELLNSNLLRTYFYETVSGPVQLEHFHDFYCWLYVNFDKFWKSQGPSSILDFPDIFSRFKQNIVQLLVTHQYHLIDLPSLQGRENFSHSQL